MGGDPAEALPALAKHVPSWFCVNDGFMPDPSKIRCLVLNTPLTELWLCKCVVRFGGAQELADAVRGSCTLTTLDLTDVQFGGGEITALTAAIQQSQSLLEVSLDQIEGIGANEAKHLARARTVTSLSLRNCAMQAMSLEAILALATDLTHSPLTRLSLTSNPLSVVGASALAFAVASHPTLHTLDVSATELTALGARQLFDACVRSQSMRALDVSRNRLKRPSDYGQGSVLPATALQLTSLDVSYTGFGLEEAEVTTKALQAKGCVVRSLDFGGNWIGERSLDRFRQALEINTSLLYLVLDTDHEMDDVVRPLAGAVFNHPNLRIVNRIPVNAEACLPCQKLLVVGDVFEMYLVREFLKANNTVETLDITCLSMESAAPILAEGLIENVSLRALLLSRQFVEARGMEVLSNAMETRAARAMHPVLCALLHAYTSLPTVLQTLCVGFVPIRTVDESKLEHRFLDGTVLKYSEDMFRNLRLNFME